MTQPPSEPESTAEPNVLLVVLDTVTAAHTSLHGAREETTPGLEALAEGATVYTEARASSNWSLPSHATLFTGVPALSHRLTMDRAMVEGATLFERLAREGYETGVFSANPWLTSHPSGFGHAFETVGGVEAFDGDGAYLHGSRSGDEPDGYWFAEQFLAWVRNGEGPWAACLNLMDAHFPYTVRPGHDAFGGPVAWSVHDELPRRWEWDVYAGDLSRGVPRLLESLYRSAIRQADAVAAGVWEELEAAGVAAETLLVVTSDHGECFGGPPAGPGEPIALEHGLGTHESLYHVPLVVKAPGQREGRRIHSLAGQTRLPRAVMAARNGATVDPGWFVAPGGQVTAHQPPVHSRVAERARTVCRHPERYEGSATLLYTDRGDDIEKRAAYADSAYATSVTSGRGRGTQRQFTVDPDAVRDAANGVVPDRFARGSCTRERAASETTDTDDALLGRQSTDTDDVTARLADLGYL